SFDANGNRNSTGYTTGSGNLMSSDGTYDYQHDADGNTTIRTQIASTYSTQYQTTYTWDYRNRLTDVEYYDNNDVLTKHVHFVYDVFDHLIATEVDPNGGGSYTGIQHYVLDVSPEIPQAGVPGTATAKPDLEFDGSGNLIQRNLVALSPAGVDAVLVQGTVSSLTQGDTDVFVAYDNLGTPRDDVDGTGTLVNHKVFSVFGKDVYDSNPSVVNWAGFAGGHDDPNTGLVNDYHRWYDPSTGRWLSADPMGFSAGDSDLERYAANSPVSMGDPTGLAPPASGPQEGGPRGSPFMAALRGEYQDPSPLWVQLRWAAYQHGIAAYQAQQAMMYRRRAYDSYAQQHRAEVQAVYQSRRQAAEQAEMRRIFQRARQQDQT
ncbi:MAG: RHS repeat-associated core domain-containing protein, partial [Pirellulales bacterium]